MLLFLLLLSIAATHSALSLLLSASSLWRWWPGRAQSGVFLALGFPYSLPFWNPVTYCNSASWSLNTYQDASFSGKSCQNIVWGLVFRTEKKINLLFLEGIFHLGRGEIFCPLKQEQCCYMSVILWAFKVCFQPRMYSPAQKRGTLFTLGLLN